MYSSRAGGVRKTQLEVLHGHLGNTYLPAQGPAHHSDPPSPHSKLQTGLQTVCRRSADPSMVSQLPTPLPTPYRPPLPTPLPTPSN